MKRTLRLGSWKIQGMATKYEEVFQEEAKYEIDICALTVVSSVQEDIRTSKNLFWEKTTEQINTCAGNTNANKAWKTLKSMRTQNKDRSGLNLISMKEWTDHFENLFTEDKEEFISSNDRIQEDTNRHMILVEQQEISTEDVRVALSNMKNGKAPRIGNIHVELLKAACFNTTIQ
ncbi:hypothetical protein HHI36_018770 [Cryptolaemus montrouzieri]|uniref:Uncharacterized protein n=1 Tax=Cryptolaemus montrouzieri TaxID=559131 RepID=A0ABD2P1B3_9CUCU